MSDYLLAHGDALRLPLADRSVHCVITSPPYYGLRDYSTPGQIGLEPSPEAFVAAMVRVFAEVRRVLRDDGTLWLNLGDSFNSSPSNQNGGAPAYKERQDGIRRNPEKWQSSFAGGGRRKRDIPGLAQKNLIGIPWRVAFALQADGWILRSDIIWAKPNPMPESVTDRPTKSHEYLFLLSKAPTYYYDADAVRESSVQPERAGLLERSFSTSDPTSTLRQDVGRAVMRTSNRNKRSVWTVPTRAFKGAHFATFPTALVTPCIKAGTSQAGCCPGCGTSWKRLVERERVNHREERRGMARGNAHIGQQQRIHNTNGQSSELIVNTLGWAAACSCPPHDPVPCTVLDPFAGAASVGVACAALGRRFVGVDLSPKYLRMARRRLERPHARPEPAPRAEAELPLFAHLDG